MDATAIQTFTSPVVLSFVLGLVAAIARSDLAIPEAIAKGMSLYLMAAIGPDGGAAAGLGVLCARASYIAVPAAIRLALPEADPGIYLTVSLSVTFPFNILINVGLIIAFVQALALGPAQTP